LGPGDFMALYVGTHGMAHGLGSVLEAAERLRDRPEVRFVLVGEGADKQALRERASRLRLQNVTFVDQQPRQRIPLYLAASDASLVLLKEKPLFKTVLPSKIFEILAAGRALILGVDGEARRLVEEAGAGVYVRPEDAGELAEAVLNLQGRPRDCEQMGRRGRAFVEQGYSRGTLARKYLDVLGELTGA
ncbi:MAG TPA: glycosyltransferase family 4 protein, partial [Myxococcaceae bacterium]|nr:glycosyltransferase family 4 protein [Myxococcaceae bacterium]